MILPLAALVLQFAATPQNLSLRAVSINAESGDATLAEPAAKATAETSVEPLADATPAPHPDPKLEPSTALPLQPILPARDPRLAIVSPVRPSVSRTQPALLHRHKWLALMLTEHSAASLDAWSTRRAISTGRFREANPTLRPFAQNASLYVAIQVAPFAFDYLGKRMMASHNGFLRHTWWIPQALSTAVSLGSSAHNLASH
jgi:hypothetical protein